MFMSLSREDLDLLSAATDEQVEKYGVFDIKTSSHRLFRNRCTKDNPCPRFVRLYAKMGLHRYNLLQGTKFKLKYVRKYIESLGSAVRSYYMTVDAIDTSAGGSSSVRTFQTKISEETCGQFCLSCDIARFQGESISDKETMYVDSSIPQWPLENPFERHCLGKEEVKSNDWIRLYVELALATFEDKDGDMKFKLKIVNVATDLRDDEGLNARNATFYIRYLDKSKGNCIAVVRRRFDEDTGCFSLSGQSHLSSEILSKKRKIVGGGDSIEKRIKTGLHEAANQEDVSSDSLGDSME